MNPDQVGDILAKTISVIFLMAAPVLFAGLAVGFLVSIFQAATQINEVTLVFIPKMLVTGLVLWLTGGWIFEQLSGFVHEITVAISFASQGGT